MPVILGLSLWDLLAGSAVLGGGAYVADKVVSDAGKTASQAGDAASKTADLAKWMVLGGALFVGYHMAKKGGLVK